MYFFFFLGQSPRIAISRRGDFSKKISRCRVVEKFLPPARRVTHFLKCSLAIMHKGRVHLWKLDVTSDTKIVGHSRLFWGSLTYASNQFQIDGYCI